MKKNLIGWLAVQHDLNKADPYKKIEASVNTNGPNYQLHKHFYGGYDEHVILFSNDRNHRQAMMLKNKIEQDFSGHRVETRLMNISNVIDLEEIKPKVENLLLEYKDEQVDIFFSPGTSIMQLAWYICHTTLGMNTRLLQTVGSRDRKGKKPEILELKTEKSQVPYSSVIKMQHLEQLEKGQFDDIKMT